MKRSRGPSYLMTILLIVSFMAGCTDVLGGNSSPSAKMTITPSGTVKAGDSLTFSAAGSSDPDGDSLTFEWTFGDGNTGTGLTTSYSYSQPGDYVVKLAVGDGTHEATASSPITVVDASARKPHAEITPNKDNECDGEEPPQGDFVIIWVCEDDRETDNTKVEVSTTVTLDGSNSWAGCDPDDSSCYADEYIVEWRWDLDTDFDSDNDGVPDNDEDAYGETYSWEEVPAGAWEVKLTVVDNNGFEESTESVVYVNYRGVWSDFMIDRASPNNPNVIMTWEYPVTYDQISKDRIRYMRAKLSYPQQDEDQPGGGLPGTTTNNRLDLYMYNSTDEEVANTTGIENDNRDAGDCGSEDYCVWIQIGGSTVRGFQPGDWTLDLQNSETHNTEVNELIIELQYR